MARLQKTSYEMKYDFTKHRGAEDFWNTEQAFIKQLAQKLRAKHDGELVGHVLNFQRADSYAQYIVVKENPLTLAHLIIGDGYTVEPALIRGLRIDDVRQMVIKSNFARGVRKPGWVPSA